ncbi:uncharacterized protein PHALS_03234 [Plasmopara halstedii]|uniref:Uncharacterized protein n=1 Tax=Plasmopara halstedii TaxID=4781 RepID=A0A0P1A8K6_PLAHL|nr:uncharacterized protein PHALS_03234 [Plasmopara halstedii]CEG36625.1 hypothetical protein PHALS_03234 [Plasmopara halstedii]|eukprot:XP_024572994.1 hypothetical protein PHALS_03234 [Plasmopara halstedii]
MVNKSYTVISPMSELLERPDLVSGWLILSCNNVTLQLDKQHLVDECYTELLLFGSAGKNIPVNGAIVVIPSLPL